MSRKQHPKDPSGFVFDARSGAVRAQGGCSENMKEKVQAVRAVVPNRSNTEIVLVLQHFDNGVERAVQAFVEGNASEVLKEWTVTGKKKNKKKKPKAEAAPGAAPAGNPRQENWEKLENLGISINGFHGNHGRSLESLSEAGAAPAPPGPAQSPEPGQGRKLGSSLEKSLKDLQRCSVALARFRALLRDEVETSLRRVKGAFSELQGCLMDREVALLAEMDKVKAEAMELLALRQRRAEALRELTEAAPGMSEEQLLELRADIKHFVSERKFDEELGRAGRFGCDLDALRGSIGAFGQVSHPRPSYSSRSRPGPASGSAPGSLGSAPGSTPAFPRGSSGSTSGSAPGSSGSAPGSTPAFPTGSLGSAPAFPSGSALGSTPGSSGSAPGSSGSAPAFPRGSNPGSTSGSAPGSSGSAPGSPQGSAAPTEPPPTPQPPQRSRKPPGAAGPRPPGIPKNPKNPKNPESPKNPGSPQIPKNPKNPQNPQIPKNPKTAPNPESPQIPKNPKNAQNPEIPKNPKTAPKPGGGARGRPGKPRRSRPEGANS